MNDQLQPFPPSASLSTPPARRSTAGHWIAIFVLLLLLGISVLANIILVIIAATGAVVATGEGGLGSHKFVEERLGGKGRNKVVQIEVIGVISYAGRRSLFGFEEDMATQIVRQIEAAEKDPDVIGILLLVDSPGGGVTASDVIYDRLLRFKSSGERPRKVVTLMRDLAASGGYYVSVAADKIVAHRTTITGSIGVLISALNVRGLGEKLGIRDVTIKSGANKDLLNPFREPTAHETNILQATVNDLYDRFVSVVARSRGLEEAEVRELADGRIYTATQALEAHLIDEIGYEENALALMKQLTGVEEFRRIRYRRSRTLADILTARLQPLVDLPVPERWRAETPVVQYLWQPEL
ncbi:MAG: signal peptide peptidase SppA [bacterium]|nr:signal peptide peptidase SppA [bacterium]